MICTKTFEGHREWIRCIKCISKYKLISGSDDYSIKVWNLETGECLRTLKGHEDSVTCFEFLDEKLISGSWDGTIKIWDLSKYECLKTLVGHSYRVSNLKTYGNKLLSSSWDCQIKIWDLANSKCIRTLKVSIFYYLI
jgi:F-box/WD-40 domain protein 7